MFLFRLQVCFIFMFHFIYMFRSVLRISFHLKSLNIFFFFSFPLVKEQVAMRSRGNVGVQRIQGHRGS